MKAFFLLLIFYLLINVLMIALGIGIGFVLHWILPAVEIGVSILIGVVASGISLYFAIRIYNYLGDYADEVLFLEDLEEIAPPPPPRPKRQQRKSKK